MGYPCGNTELIEMFAGLIGEVGSVGNNCFLHRHAIDDFILVGDSGSNIRIILDEADGFKRKKGAGSSLEGEGIASGDLPTRVGRIKLNQNFSAFRDGEFGSAATFAAAEESYAATAANAARTGRTATDG